LSNLGNEFAPELTVEEQPVDGVIIVEPRTLSVDILHYYFRPPNVQTNGLCSERKALGGGNLPPNIGS